MRKNQNTKPPYYVASCSWGKDSTAMLLVLLESDSPLQEVIYVKMGYEFKSIDTVARQFRPLLENKNIKYTELDVSDQFKESLEKYQWCGGACRHGTAIKLEALRKYYRTQLGDYNVFEYVGIAADESLRAERKLAAKGQKIYPLIDAGIREQDALDLCYQNGFFWEEAPGVYAYRDVLGASGRNGCGRLSCICCRNKNLAELAHMYFNAPAEWQVLRELQAKFNRPFYQGKMTIFELEERFKRQGCVTTLQELVDPCSGKEEQ